MEEIAGEFGDDSGIVSIHAERMGELVKLR